MAFIISKAQQQQQSLTETDEKKYGGAHEVSEAQQQITSHVYLKSSAAMDRDVVLRRIRHHKKLSKLKTAFETLLGSSKSESSQAASPSWLHQEDSFSSP